MIKYFVTPSGTYIGGFDGGEPPTGAIETPCAPIDARQIWDFGANAWGPTPPDPTKRMSDIDARLLALDLEAIRPLRAIEAGAATQYDRDKLAALDAEADTLRSERAGLL